MSAIAPIVITVPPATGAGTTKTIIPVLGQAGRVKGVYFNAAVTHATGTSAAVTVAVKKGADNALVTIATTEVGSSLRDTTNVEKTIAVTDSSTANVLETDRITVSVTTAGGTAATGSGFVVYLLIGPPNNP